MSGADAWVARDLSPAGGAVAEAALYSEVGVGGACGATGSTVPAGAAVLAEAGKRSGPLKREAAPDAAPSAAEPHWRRFPRRPPPSLR